MKPIKVPYSKLILSTDQQARQTSVTQESIKPLAASIKTLGLLQNMVVIKSKKRGFFEVVAGGRRWAALGLLLSDGHIKAEDEFDVKLIDTDLGLKASLSENFQREAMHPADEFAAFSKLIDQGFPLEDVAATFGVDTKVVAQRMKLARVAPALIQHYRNEKIKLNVLMAYTLTDDHDRQMMVWDGLSEWQRGNPHAVRNALTEHTIDADHKWVRFVGVQAYKDAGGLVSQDLFTDGDSGVIIEQPQVVHELALTKLQALAQEMKDTGGWAWADAALEIDLSELRRFGRVKSIERDMTAEEVQRLADLQTQYDALINEMQVLEQQDDDQSNERYWELHEKNEELSEQMQAIEEGTQDYTPEAKSIAGIILTIDIDGTLKVHEGLIRSEDRQNAVQANNAQAEQGGSELTANLPGAKTRPTHSERLVRQLTANKTGIVAAALLEHPNVGLAVLAAKLAYPVLSIPYADGLDAVKISITDTAFLINGAAEDFEGSKAHAVWQEHRNHWLDELPKDSSGSLLPLLPWALEQDTTTLIELLTFCVSASLDGIQGMEQKHGVSGLDDIARVTALDMTQWWEPTASSYLSHVNKERLVEVVSEVRGTAEATPLLKMKKTEAITQAANLIAGKGWVPTLMRIGSNDK